MQLPPTNPDTLFEELLQDLPPKAIAMARDRRDTNSGGPHMALTLVAA